MPTAEQTALCSQHDIDRICFMNGEWLPVGELPKIAPAVVVIPDTPAALARAWGGANPYDVLTQGIAQMLLTQEIDPAIDLINELDEPDRKEALMIAYQWSLSRRESVTEITKTDFLNRAKNDRKCEYLKLNRNQVWEDLQTLLEP